MTSEDWMRRRYPNLTVSYKKGLCIVRGGGIVLAVTVRKKDEEQKHTILRAFKDAVMIERERHDRKK